MRRARRSDGVATTAVNELYTLPLEIVVSAPRLPPWLLYIPGAHLLNTINTTHWGVKVGETYHDLKMEGLFRTKPWATFAATLAERDERPASRTIPIGHTHLTPDEVKVFVKHRLTHTSWYHFWYENCQHFAVAHVAMNIRCHNNHSNGCDAEEEENLCGLDEVSMHRHTDYFPLSYHLWRYMVAAQRRKRSLFGILLIWLITYGFLFWLGKGLREEELVAMEDATVFEQEASNVPSIVGVREERGRDYKRWQTQVAEWKKSFEQERRSPKLKDAEDHMFSLLEKLVWQLYETSNRIPWMLSRKGRSSFIEPCKYCVTLRSTVRFHTSRCLELGRPLSTAPTVRSVAQHLGHMSFKQRILAIWSEHPEDTTNALYRGFVPCAVYFVNTGKPFSKQVEYQLITHLILNFASPITEWGTISASTVSIANTLWSAIGLLYGLYGDGGYMFENHFPLGVPTVGLNGLIFAISLAVSLPVACLLVPWG